MFESLFPILWGIYPEAKLLDHTVIVRLIFRRITQSFSMAAPLYIPTNSAHGL